MSSSYHLLLFLFLQQALSSREYGWIRKWNHFSRTAQDEWKLKSAAFAGSMQPVMQTLTPVGQVAAQKYQHVARAAHVMYKKNEFYMQDLRNGAVMTYNILR